MDNSNEENNERNYGIDFLRIIAIFFVVILHSLGKGGLLTKYPSNSIQYKTIWLTEIFAYCAVNIFALISGYVAYSDKEIKIRYSKYVKLWLKVVFYGILITFIFDCLKPNIISTKEYLMDLFPIMTGQYWYFTAYTGLFFLMPLLNNGIKSCSNNIAKISFFIIILFFSLFDFIGNRFMLNDGYSCFWLILLYLLGSIIKKCNIGKSLKRYKCIIIMVLLYLLTYFYKIYGNDISILNIKIGKEIFISYTSPTIVGIAIYYIIIFSQIKYNIFFKKIIRYVSSSAFVCYIINSHRFIVEYVIKEYFNKIDNHSTLNVFINIFGFSLLFFILSIVIDKIRLFLIKKMKLDMILNKLKIN